MVASGVFLALGVFVNLPSGLSQLLIGLFPISIVVNLLITLMGKFAMPFSSEVAMLGSREMTHGKYRNHFWWGGIAMGHIVPLVLFFSAPIIFPAAVLTCAIGLFFYEYAFVLAPQHIPNS